MSKQFQELLVLRIKKQGYNVRGGAYWGLGWGIFVCIGVFRTLNYVKLTSSTYDYSSLSAVEECT